MKSISSKSLNQFSSFHNGRVIDIATPEVVCDGALGECIQEDKMTIEYVIIRRNLAGKRRYISYDALEKNRAPCKCRGHSYYGCGRSAKVNPYRRGCSRITHCIRSIN